MIAFDVRSVFAGKLNVLFSLQQEGANVTSMKEVMNNDMNETETDHYLNHWSKKCPIDSKLNKRSD